VLDIAGFALGIARPLALSRMTDTCTLDHMGPMVTASDGSVSQIVTQVYPDPAWPATHPLASGPCFVQAYDQQESTPETAGATVTVRRYRYDIPVGSCDPGVGMVATIITSEHDPNLPGSQLRITSPLGKTAATAYRLGAEAGVFYVLPEPDDES
jgi:hypothetical protein